MNRDLTARFARVRPIAIALLPFVVLAVWHANWSPGADSGDYAQYILHARALIDGRAYADIGYLYHPEAADIGPPAYPPGLPLALVPIIALTAVNMVVLRLFMLACMIGFGVLAYVRLVRDLPVPMAATGVAFALFDIEAQLGTLAPISDPPFCTLLWLLFVVADSPDRWSWRRTGVVTLLGFLLISFRLAGAAIVPALGLFGVLRWRKNGIRPLVPVAIWGVVFGAIALAQSNPYSNVVNTTHVDLGRKLFFLLQQYRFLLFNAELYPFPANALNDAYHLLITPVVLVGAVVVVRRLGVSLVSCFVVVYVALLLAVRVGDVRYLWPLLPLVGASLAQGITTLAGRLVRPDTAGHERPNRLRWAAIAIPGLVIAGALAHQLTIPAPFAITGTADATDLYHWLSAENTLGRVRVLFHNPRVLTLSSGVPAMGVLDRTTPGQLAAIDERRISHVVWQRADVSDCLQHLANELPVQFPDRFELAYENPTFKVYRVRTAGTPFHGPYARLDWRHPESFCGKT